MNTITVGDAECVVGIQAVGTIAGPIRALASALLTACLGVNVGSAGTDEAILYACMSSRAFTAGDDGSDLEPDASRTLPTAVRRTREGHPGMPRRSEATEWKKHLERVISCLRTHKKVVPLSEEQAEVLRDVVLSSTMHSADAAAYTLAMLLALRCLNAFVGKSVDSCAEEAAKLWLDIHDLASWMAAAFWEDESREELKEMLSDVPANVIAVALSMSAAQVVRAAAPLLALLPIGSARYRKDGTGLALSLGVPALSGDASTDQETHERENSTSTFGTLARGDPAAFTSILERDAASSVPMRTGPNSGLLVDGRIVSFAWRALQRGTLAAHGVVSVPPVVSVKLERPCVNGTDRFFGSATATELQRSHAAARIMEFQEISVVTLPNNTAGFMFYPPANAPLRSILHEKQAAVSNATARRVFQLLPEEALVDAHAILERTQEFLQSEVPGEVLLRDTAAPPEVPSVGLRPEVCEALGIPTTSTVRSGVPLAPGDESDPAIKAVLSLDPVDGAVYACCKDRCPIFCGVSATISDGQITWKPPETAPEAPSALEPILWRPAFRLTVPEELFVALQSHSAGGRQDLPSRLASRLRFLIATSPVVGRQDGRSRSPMDKVVRHACLESLAYTEPRAGKRCHPGTNIVIGTFNEELAREIVRLTGELEAEVSVLRKDFDRDRSTFMVTPDSFPIPDDAVSEEVPEHTTVEALACFATSPNQGLVKQQRNRHEMARCGPRTQARRLTVQLTASEDAGLAVAQGVTSSLLARSGCRALR
jgi:hypothetical protein